MEEPRKPSSPFLGPGSFSRGDRSLLNDLARIYAQQGENRLALKYIGETLKRDANQWGNIDNDSAFDRVRANKGREYEEILGGY
ncbi:MAG: hypothetical protein M1299_13800 [Firmicutes bacterium]|nr:hypothetical protein [Bacillota bacterium]